MEKQSHVLPIIKQSAQIKYVSFILSLEGISSKDKTLTPIIHDKITHLANIHVTTNEFMDKVYVNNELSDVICEHCSKLSDKSHKANFEKYQSILKPPTNLRILL